MALMRIDLKPGEQLQIGDVTVTFERKSGQSGRLAIDADKSVPIKKIPEEAPGIRLIAERGIMTA
jgi:sRNA-binding carbon storage regulator CsrA